MSGVVDSSAQTMTRNCTLRSSSLLPGRASASPEPRSASKPARSGADRASRWAPEPESRSAGTGMVAPSSSASAHLLPGRRQRYRPAVPLAANRAFPIETGEFKGRAIFATVDVNDIHQTSSSEGVRSMPTFKFFSGGREVDSTVGADRAKLARFVEKAGGASGGA